MYYIYSKISLVFAIWGVSKDTVFALFLLKRQCLRLGQLGRGAIGSERGFRFSRNCKRGQREADFLDLASAAEQRVAQRLALAVLACT